MAVRACGTSKADFRLPSPPWTLGLLDSLEYPVRRVPRRLRECLLHGWFAAPRPPGRLVGRTLFG